MRHYYTRDGEEKTTYFYFENHLVSSYFSAITGKPSELTIEALTDSRLLTFPYAHLKSLYDQSPKWERFGRLLAEYVAMGLEERMAGLLMMSPEERYLQLLQGNKQKIIERIPQHYIANYLGITPVSLSRIRKRLGEK
jgi:CRP-like cAMP-binding protein